MMLKFKDELESLGKPQLEDCEDKSMGAHVFSEKYFLEL